MARKPSKPIEANDERLKLLEALKFAAIATAGNDVTSYVAISGGFVSAFNDTFTIGCPFAASLDLCPQADKFAAALQQCGQNFQLTQVSLSAISIKSGNFRALVPAVTADIMAPMTPDAAIAPLEDTLKEAFAACYKLITKGDRVINQCLQMRSGSCVATNGAVAMEFWHGVDLPSLLIPRKTVETIAKIAKPLKAFGMSQTSATFYFEDGSWLKSRLCAGEYPDVDRLYGFVNQAYIPIWETFYAGLDAISKFVEDDTFYMFADHVGTHRQIELGASYKVPGMQGVYAFTPAYWQFLRQHVTHVSISQQQGAPFALYGPRCRALVMGKNTR